MYEPETPPKRPLLARAYFLSALLVSTSHGNSDHRHYHHHHQHHHRLPSLMTRPEDGPITTIHRPLDAAGFPELVVITQNALPGTSCPTLDLPLEPSRRDGVSEPGLVEKSEGGNVVRTPVLVEFRVYAAGTRPTGEDLSSGLLTSSPLCEVQPLLLPLVVALFAVSWYFVQPGQLGYYIRSWYALFRMRYLVYGAVGGLIVSRLFRYTIYESISAIPGIGVQLETKKGYRLPQWLRRCTWARKMGTATLPPTVETIARSSQAILHSLLTTTTTAFIPLRSLRPASPHNAADSVIIHEGLQRWSVRFYIAIMHCVRPEGSDSLHCGSVASTGGDEDRPTGGEEWKVHVGFPTLQPRLPILREVYYGLRQVMFDDFEQDQGQPL